MPGPLPLAGRDAELAVMRTLRSRGDARGIVLAGGPGVGKTRLAAEFTKMWPSTASAVFRLTATEASVNLPLGVFGSLLPSSIEHGGEQSPHWRTTMLRDCAAQLVAAAAGRRMVLTVDNAHLLDDVSATLVHQLVERDGAFLIATVERGAPAPAPISTLSSDESVVRLEVPALGPDAFDQLLSAYLGGPVDRAAVAGLRTLCAGNLQYLRELVLASIRDGALTEDTGLWRLVGPVRPTARLIEMVEVRLAGLGRDERAVLELVAFGESLSESVIAGLGVTSAAEDLERRGLVTCSSSGSVLYGELACPAHGVVLRATTPALRRRQIVRALACAFEADGAAGPDQLLRAATWRLEEGGGDPGRLLGSAGIAMGRGDFGLAETLIRAAAGPGRSFEAELTAGRLALRRGRLAEADTALERLLDSAEDDARRVQVCAAWVDGHLFALGRTEAALRVARLAEPRLSDPDRRAQLAAKAEVLSTLGRGPGAAVAATSALLHRSTGAELAWAAIPAAHVQTRRGRSRDALRATDRGYAAHRMSGEPLDWHPGVHLFLRAEALASAVGFDQAHDLAQEQYDLAVREQSAAGQAWAAWQLCRQAAERGGTRSSVAYGRAAVALFHRLGGSRFGRLASVDLSIALALAGQADQASDTLGGLEPDDADVGWWACDLPRARAWASVASGDLPSALELLGRAQLVAERLGDLAGELVALHTVVRLGQPHRVLRRLEEVASGFDGEPAQSRVRHARALLEGDPEGLDQVAAEFERQGALLLAAETAAQAGSAWRGAGQTRRAARASYRCGLLAQRCEDPATPALRSVSAARLTRAEHEVAIRAASGCSNKCIAEELYVSRRTVEKQLEHVYGKLGVAGRRELAGVFGSS